MGRIDDALLSLAATEDKTERAFQLAGLLSTLFKTRGIVLVVTGQLAFDSYANSTSDQPEIDLATFSGKLAPRTILEIMRGQLGAKGAISHWQVGGVPVRFTGDTTIAHRELCRDFTTEHGVVKLEPVEEITADRILAASFPEIDYDAHGQARLLLINGLSEAFQMDWARNWPSCGQQRRRMSMRLARRSTRLTNGSSLLLRKIRASPRPRSVVRRTMA